MTEQEPTGDRAIARKKKLSVLSQLIPSHCHHRLAEDGHSLNPGVLIRRHMSIFGGIISGFFSGSTAGYSLSFNGNISIQRIRGRADDENETINGHSPPSNSSRKEEIIRLESEIRHLEQLYRRKVNELSQLVDE
ncbi:hypothetical protein Y032_0271g901 [Ancylostoma ceylanicum]|nr:hypothetical protein Y032_0271g901 [Ancylostoma ceylanicum]